MAYHTAEYRREEDSRDNKNGGWRSWFGLDNKDRDEDRGYSYSNTTTYRNPTTPSYGPHPERSGYGYSGPMIGSRGGYGYTTSDEVNRGPSWNTDRDYNTRSGYGTTGDRDVYYKQETRTYGGDSQPWTSGSGRPWTPSRSYGFSGERDYPSRGYTSGGPLPSYSSRYQTDSDYPSYPSKYPVTGDYSSSRYPTSGDYSSSRYPTSGDYSSSRTYGFSGERDTYPTSRGYGYSGERDTYPRGYSSSGPYSGEYNRPSYQSTSYRY